MPYSNPLIVAIDTSDLSEVIRLVAAVRPHCFAVKFGLEFFLAHGARGIHAVLNEVALSDYRTTHEGQPFCPFMLDLKFHDIPSTVAAAVRAVLPIRPWALTVHASGGTEMMRAAVVAADDAPRNARPNILAVTILTSSVANDADTEREVIRLADSAMEAGCDGIVCAAPDITPKLRRMMGARLIVCPGIRSTVDVGDHRRVAHPRTAMRAGADYIVVGRPITQATDPAAAAKRHL